MPIVPKGATIGIISNDENDITVTHLIPLFKVCVYSFQKNKFLNIKVLLNKFENVYLTL